MATKKRSVNQRAYEQFSKRLSKWLLIFWAVYRILTLIVAIIRPDITTGLTTLTHGVDDAAMCVVISYTVNSATEKVTTNYFAAKGAERTKTSGSSSDKEDEKKEGNNG